MCQRLYRCRQIIPGSPSRPGIPGRHRGRLLPRHNLLLERVVHEGRARKASRGPFRVPAARKRLRGADRGGLPYSGRALRYRRVAVAIHRVSQL